MKLGIYQINFKDGKAILYPYILSKTSSTHFEDESSNIEADETV